MRAGWSK
jgi:hypothetical protein